MAFLSKYLNRQQSLRQKSLSLSPPALTPVEGGSDRQGPSERSELASGEDGSDPQAPSAPVAQSQDGNGEDQLASLMSAVKHQAITLKCEQVKVALDLEIGLDLLTSRMATLEPLLTKSLQANAERGQTIARLNSLNDELSQSLSDAERDLAHYRPIAIQLEEELRNVRSQLSDRDRRMSELEAEYAKAQGLINSVVQKAATADSARQRVMEENAAYAQKLHENDAALQVLVRDAAQFQSELVSVSSDVERLEGELRIVTKKLAAECEEHGRTRSNLQSVQAQLAQNQKESQARIREAEERVQHAREMLSVRDKQCHDFDIRESALASKIDFLTKTNQRYREDLRRHTDHIGNLEASNRQLLDSIARDGNETEGAPPAERPENAGPKLRAVKDTH